MKNIEEQFKMTKEDEKFYEDYLNGLISMDEFDEIFISKINNAKEK